MPFHIFFSFFIWPCFLIHSVSSQALPPVYSHPIINLSSKNNLAKDTNLRNPAGITYTTMDATDFYVSRLTNKGKLEIFDINSKKLKFNLFASIGYPENTQVISYDLSDMSNTTLAVVVNANQALLYTLL